ncbi:hypothetical protein PN492_16420 [Dolichospermum circinale CS-537/01]|uniref:Uncharacterized protein n=1 Tax=Dolichospermum circinale CS-537/01 TaxID=3021739 RepID=A0ABT5A9I8_9CYAN|nr:hypothetical protein [Dolichospermum circinale]MDB9488113.1 hypothetical protein [Dolichospermum circinale CS-537/01]
MEKIKQKFPNAPEIPADTLNNKMDEFTNCEHDQVFRGKYEMWFLLIFLRLILIDSNKSKLFISEKLSFAFNNDHSSPSPILSNEQALKIFSDHAETPESLNIYLMQVIK